MSPLLASLLHSLWMGLLLWLAVLGVMRLLPGSAVFARHAVALVATVALFFGWGTAWMVARSGESAAPVVETPEPVIVDAEGAPVVFPEVSKPGEPIDSRASSERTFAADVTARIDALRTAEKAQTSLEMIWAAGVLIGLARLAWDLRTGGARWLAGQAFSPVPEVWTEAWRRVLALHGDRMKVTLAAIQAKGTPFVIGLLEPVIVVPLASCAGVTPELARAALAHELAHVARRDWLVEIGLRTIEAVLFFNPFARLLSARVRAEREACCDFWACERLAVPRGEFAEALATWARMLLPGHERAGGALGLGDGLRGRIQRLLGVKGGLRPRAKTWRGAIGAAALVLIGLAGYGVALRCGAEALRDAERVALLEDVAAPYRLPDHRVSEPESDARFARVVSGRVADGDGRPVPRARIKFWNGDPRDECSATSGADGVFRLPRPVRRAGTLRARAEGFAVRVIAVEAEEAELSDPIVLGEGTKLAVRVLNQEGRSLGGARVYWDLDYYARNPADQALADEAGVAWMKNLPEDIAVYVRAEADGYAVSGVGALSKDVLRKGIPLEMRLHPGREARLRIVETDGRPMEKVAIHIDSSEPAWSLGSNPYPSWSYGGLITDKEGRVTLKHLRRDASYRLRASGPGLDDLAFALGESVEEQVVTLSRERSVDVSLMHFPEAYHGKQVRFQVSSGDDRGRRRAQFHSVKIDETGKGRVKITGRGTGPVELSFQDLRLSALRGKHASWEALGSGLVLDYDRMPAEARAVQMRRVAIRFVHDGEELFPGGRFYIHRLSAPHFWDADGFALKPGERLFAEWPDGTKLKLTNGWAMIGASVDMAAKGANEEIVVEAGLSAIVVPVRPAGMVRAQVRESSGRVARGARIAGSTDHAEWTKRRRVEFPNNQTMGEWQVSGPVEFSFWGTPLWAANGLVFARGPNVSVSARKPVAEAVVRLPETRTYSLRLIDEAGRGVAGAGCRLNARFREKKLANPPFGLVERSSDTEGWVRFEAGVDFTGWDGLDLLVDASAPGLARTAAAIDVGKLSEKEAAVLTLPSAAEFRVRFVDRSTGHGVPGIEVHWVQRNVWQFFQQDRMVSGPDGWAILRDLAAARKFRLEYRGDGLAKFRFVEDSNQRRSDPWREMTVADSGLMVELEPR